MKILLTGVAGFIASRVAEFLLEKGHTVVGVDNMNDAYDVRLKEWRLSRLKKYPNFTFHRLDISDFHALQNLFKTMSYQPPATSHQPSTMNHQPSAISYELSANHQPSAINHQPFHAVINLAARAGVRQSVKNPWVYYEANVTGTLNLLELCREYGIKKFILASTSSLYGKHNPMPYREDADTSTPLSPYAASKKAAETLCYTYHYLHGFSVVVLRYFTVYGPAGRPDMSPFRFVQWIVEGRPVKVFGDGSQSRDFTYVDDIARGTIAAMEYVSSEDSFPIYEIVNLGSDTPVVLMDVIKLIEELTGRRAKLEFLPMHPADVPATWANIEKAEKLFGWRPRVSLEDGMKNLVSWYMENRSWTSTIDTLNL